MTARVASQRFRQRKLSTKQNLTILREGEIEPLPDDDAARNIPKLETGVEKAEEVEHHLQAIISASQVAGGKIAELYIPTPPTVASKVQYERLYPRTFQQPATYIRFSSTVEDCIGCPYCMTSDDAVFLKQINEKRKGKGPLCSEDEFEQAMYFFEETAAAKQPFAEVDNAPVIPYEEMESAFDETIEEGARRFAKEIYEHWKNRRALNENRSLMPSLKFEKNLDTDDSDPYVCFRRREVRQIRKTRGRDAQVTERLKKLRRELEEARRLMAMIKDREATRRDQLAFDRQIFMQRAALKETKRNIGLKSSDDDVLLINQKVETKPKPKVEASTIQRGIPGMGPKPQLTRADGRLLDSDLELLQDKAAKREEEIQKFIDENLEKHKNWNRGWEDITWRPITPPLEQASRSSFRVAAAEYLPTPPSSETSDQGSDRNNTEEGSRRKSLRNTAPTVRYVSPPYEAPSQPQRAYRRRIGRGGRLMIDRRGVQPSNLETIDERVADRFKFDRDSEDDDELYPVDVYDNMHIKYRILLEKSTGPPKEAQAALQGRRVLEASAQAAHNRSASAHHLLPPSSNAPS